MFRPRIIPCLLIRDKGLVKTVKFDKATYVGDPMNAVRLLNDLGADELVFLDIDAHKEGRTIDTDLVRSISAEASMPFAVGGGIRTLDDARALIAAGAEKVILNSAATDSQLIKTIGAQFGSQSVVVCIDVKKDFWGRYRVMIEGGRKSIEGTPEEYAHKVEEWGAGEIIIQSIDRDGTMAGYDVELIRKVADAVQVPVIALGGAGEYKHFYEAVVEGGASAVAAGSRFVFYGALRAVLINYPTKTEKLKIFAP